MKRLIYLTVLAVVLGAPAVFAKNISLLNVSYDPTRELYEEINAAFAKSWKAKTGDDVSIRQSHGGSGKQARAVIDGLDADVVTLGLAYDVDALHDKARLIPADWQKRLPNNSTPFSSTIVFVVRKGNPKHIQDWDDLIRQGVRIVVPNPKSSGGARWAYLAAYGNALREHHGDTNAATAYIEQFYMHAPVLDSGARGATGTFTQHRIGDVLISWENEARLVLQEFGPQSYEIIYPAHSILAEPPVSIVDKYVDAHGTRAVAEAYLQFLYTSEGQEIAAKHFYRPSNPEIAKKFAASFQEVKFFTIDDVFGGWKNAQKVHFDDGGIFDQVLQKHR